MQNIGRYQVESELGKGAMGVVYKATDPNIGRLVALKALRLDVHGIEADEMRRRFQNEARAAGVLNHPNIITIYDAGEDQDLFYITMEFIPGETLAELLKKRRVLTVEQILAITSGICSGLDFAHSQGIIHRDVKPANIMIAPDGTAKIMDFGIAKAPGNLTNTGKVLGTPNYMSPEQVRGRPLDGRTDLFSVGVMLYEMLTGKKPFAGENVTTIIYKIVNEDPIRPTDLDSSIHPGLSAVAMRALSKEPAGRYQSGAELANDLTNYSSLSPNASRSVREPTSTTAGLRGEPTSIASASTASVATVAPAKVPAQPTVVTAARSTSGQGAGSSSMVLASTRVLEKRKNISIVVIAALIVLVFAGLIGAKRYQSRRAAQELQRMQEAQRAVQAPETSAGETAGEVSIVSTPPGAKVEIDGETRQGRATPIKSEKLSPGKHTVVLSLENYTPEKRTIEVVAGKKVNLEARLTSMYGTVHISSDPVGADVLLDGQPTGRKTPADFTLPPGAQMFTLQKQGYEDSGDTVQLQAGQRINITSMLTPTSKIGNWFRGAQGIDRGLLVVRTRPRGARVSINGVVLPAVTPVRIPIKSGRYALGIAMEGFEPIKRDVVVERGKQTGLNEELSRK